VRYKIARSDFFILSQGGALSLYDFRCPGITCPSARSAGPVGGWPSDCPPTGHPKTAYTHDHVKTQKGPRLLTGASIIAAVRAVTRQPSDRPARCAP
jgi:hypothetical protein